LDAGDLCALIGPNGAGKTTCFNVMTGVYPPTEGHVHLQGKRIDGHRPAMICRAGIARTFQNIRLFQNLSVLDNVTVALRHSKDRGLIGTVLRTPHFAREHDRAEAEGMDLLHTLQLDGRADYLAKNLPYGEQRRLEIA